MKKLLAVLLFSGSLSLAVTPDCTQIYEFTNDTSIGSQIIAGGQVLPPGPTSPINNTGGSACTAWTIVYSVSGFAQISGQLETSSVGGGPYVLWPGTVSYGSMPFTAVPESNQSWGYANLIGTYNYLRINIPFLIGTGVLKVNVYGWINSANVGSIINYPVFGSAGIVGGGTSGQFATYPATGVAVAGHTLLFSDISGLWTGSPGSTTFARGDGTWAVPSIASAQWSLLQPGTNSTSGNFIAGTGMVIEPGGGTVTTNQFFVNGGPPPLGNGTLIFNSVIGGLEIGTSGSGVYEGVNFTYLGTGHPNPTAGHFVRFIGGGTPSETSDDGYAPQGTDLNLLTSGAVGGSTGSIFCLDSNGGATNVQCGILSSMTFSAISALATPPNGWLIYCSDCLNAHDDSATFDSTAAGSGHGTNVLRENGAWRVH